VLLESPEVAGRLDAAELDRALDPAAQLGAAAALVDRALAAHHAMAGHDATVQHASEEQA
jgi:hypothetical protein